jgi:hypothetical protein
MRIFSLNTDEAVVIGDEIVIKVLGIDGDEVQIGVEYPDADAAQQAAQIIPGHERLLQTITS